MSAGRFTPVGYREAVEAGLNPHKTLLMPADLSGPADAPGNVYTAPAAFDQGILRRYERVIQKLLRQGEEVRAQVAPLYHGRELIPRAIQFDVYRILGDRDVLVMTECVPVWPGWQAPANVPAAP